MRDEEEEAAEAGNCAEQGETTRNTTRGRGETTNKRGGDMTRSRPSSRAGRLCSCLFFFFFFFNFKLYCMYVGPNPRKASPSLGEYIDCTSIYV